MSEDDILAEWKAKIAAAEQYNGRILAMKSLKDRKPFVVMANTLAAWKKAIKLLEADRARDGAT